MTTFDQNVLFMILGALIGAAISPCVEILFRKWTKQGRPVFSIGGGLVFLASANAFWALVFLLRIVTYMVIDDEISPYIYVVIYGIATVFFIVAIVQFYNTEVRHSDGIVRRSLICIAIGNSLWLISDFFEGVGVGGWVKVVTLGLGVCVLLLPLVNLVKWNKDA